MNLFRLRITPMWKNADTLAKPTKQSLAYSTTWRLSWRTCRPACPLVCHPLALRMSHDFLNFVTGCQTWRNLKVKDDHRSKFSNLRNWKEAWKKIRASTGFEPVTSAIPVRCSTNWAMKPHIGSEVNLLSSYLPMQWSDVKFIWNNSYLYCGCRWKWRMIIAVNFPI